MKEARTAPVGSPVLVIIGVALTGIGVVVLQWFVATRTYDSWGALIVGPILLAISLPILSRHAKKTGDQRLFWILVAALLLKFLGSIVRYFVIFDLYGGQADAAGYHAYGTSIAAALRNGDFSAMGTATRTDFIRLATGVVYAIFGATRMGGFLVFAWMAFWGSYLFYRAFGLAVPEGRARQYALIVFFLPSMLFWPSSLGKDAWLILALGVAAYGAARMFTHQVWRGLLIAGLGMWMAGMVRIHMAGILGLAIAAAFVVARPNAKLRQLGPLLKGTLLVVLAGLALVLVLRTEDFLATSPVGDQGEGVAAFLERNSERTGQGGSTFSASLIRSPSRIPVAAFTVVFRPMITEAHNVQALATALEGTALLAFTLWRIPWGWAAFKSIRRQPYVAFALVFSIIFIFAFSSVANFGILARQRTQLFPLFLVLLTIPPERLRDEQPSPESKAMEPALI